MVILHPLTVSMAMRLGDNTPTLHAYPPHSANGLCLLPRTCQEKSEIEQHFGRLTRRTLR